MKSSPSLRTGRARLFSLLLAVWAVVLVARLAQVQLAQSSKYRARAQRQQERRIEVSSRRGSILDREGRELAVSVEVSSVFAVPEEVPDPGTAARVLAPLLGLPEKQLLSRLAQKKGFVWLARKIDRGPADAIRSRKLAGVHLVPETKRFYPKGALAASVLGFVGTDDRGLAGLEFLYDATVRGKLGHIVALKDARQSTYGEAQARGQREREGAALVVSLDSGIQFAAERELAAAVEKAQARSGSVVLLDPWTGEILAMASVPGFDPNRYGRFSEQDRRNRSIADAYEPGSTFKIVTGAIALEEGLVALDEVIETGDGTIRVGDVTISEHDQNRYGALNLSGVFERSSNVGIIRVGLRIGPERLFAGACDFGIGRATGVDLPGESTGIFRPVSRWSSLSGASISMGQEVALTALQLARVGAVVANGGKRVEPRLVTGVIHPDGRLERRPFSPPGRVLSEATAHALRDILVAVVERGTGTQAAIPGFTVAGKTGTAQKAGIGGYQPGRYVPNFVGFAPAESPRIVCVVVIEEPTGKYYASEVAAPLFARVVSQALGILRVAPEEQRVPETVLATASPISYPTGVEPASARPPRGSVAPAALSAAAASLAPARASDIEELARIVSGSAAAEEQALDGEPKRSEAPPRGAVTPDATGLSARQALALFARLGVPARLHGAGFVVSQDPPPESPLRSDLVHKLYLSDKATPIGRPPSGRVENSSPISGP